MSLPQTDPLTPHSEGATIFEQGYRSYDGPRTGRSGALRSLVVQSLRAMMGLGRSARHKVIPFAVVLMAYVPAAVFVGIAALVPEEIANEVNPSYAGYYGFISALLFLFASFVAPELLCTDRRTGMLGVYLASPLNRPTYLVGKTISIMLLLSLITLGPPLILLIALTLADAGPESLGEWLGEFTAIAAAGTMMSAFYAAVSMAVSAATDRKGAAVAATIGALLGSTAVANTLVQAAGQSDLFRLLSLQQLPLELAFRIHDEIGAWSPFAISDTELWTGSLAIMAACAAWIWFSYRRMLVRR